MMKTGKKLLFATALCAFVLTTILISDRLLFASGPVGGSAEQRMAAIAKAVPTAVMVFEPSGNGGGSGVLVSSEGEVLTNFHVTSPCGSFMRCGLSDGKIYDAVIVGIDPVGDMAMIRLLANDPLPFAKLADSDKVRVGDPSFAAGNPFLLANNLQPSVSWGIVSGTHRYQFPSGTLLEYGDCLQTDTAINPGNSGGALFDVNADVIGIIGRCSFEKRGRVNVGIGYAISSNQAKNFLGVLRSGRVVDHATLGATVSDSVDERVRVSNILETSDAYRRGLRFGDELVSLDNREISSANELANVLATLPEGWRVAMKFRRDGRTVETLVRLPGVHSPGELVKKMNGAMPPPDQLPPKKSSPKEDGKDAPADGAPPEPTPHSSEKSPADRFDQRVVEMFESKPEMGNEYFNRKARERIVARVAKQTPSGVKVGLAWRFAGRAGGAQLQGNDTIGTPFTAMVDSKFASLKIGELAADSVPLASLYDAINQRGIGGLQAALMLWHRLVENGTNNLGDVTYYGTAPLRGTRPFRDCTILTQGEIESRVFTSVDSGQLEAIEVLADPDHDPAEVYFHWDAQDPTKLVSLELVYGTDVVANITIEQVMSAEQGNL